MIANDKLKIHVVDVGHGDATVLEFPDYGDPQAHFGVVDFGAWNASDADVVRDYMKALLALRADGASDFDYRIEFVCVTHPHIDHFRGANSFMAEFAHHSADNKVQQFWDCGFRTNALTYNELLRNILNNKQVQFVRVSAGAEFGFGDVKVTVLAPSIDLRNRFDTWGVDKNDASIVLHIKMRDSVAILAGDAQFASWGKLCEEFPRHERIKFHDDALGMAERDEATDQLKCSMLRTSHHGSKHGTNLEAIERLKPNTIVTSCGGDGWYRQSNPRWRGKFPHALAVDTLREACGDCGRTTGTDGNIILTFSGAYSPGVACFGERSGSQSFPAALNANW